MHAPATRVPLLARLPLWVAKRVFYLSATVLCLTLTLLLAQNSDGAFVRELGKAVAEILGLLVMGAGIMLVAWLLIGFWQALQSTKRP